MDGTQLAGAGVVLVAAVVASTVAHELVHALALWASGVDCEVAWLPDRDDRGLLGAGAFGTWASVTPRDLSPELPAWRLRLAAVAPVALAAPFALVVAGVLPDPFETGDVYRQAAVVGWLACTVPSPQDFSLFWHADRAIEQHGREPDGDGS